MTRRIDIHARVLTIRKLAKWLGQDFDIVTTQDIERLINQLERSDYCAWTKHDYKVAIKRFYKWLNGGNEYPEAVKWITRARTRPPAHYDATYQSCGLNMQVTCIKCHKHGSLSLNHYKSNGLNYKYDGIQASYVYAQS